MKRKMLITGVSGMLGSNLAYYFRNQYEVLGLYNRHPVEIEKTKTHQVDIVSEASLNSVMLGFSPDIIVHCASLTDIDYCEENKGETETANVLGTRNVVNSVNSQNSKIIYISSDSVYDGTKGYYSETDQTNPQNYYGVTKFKGELEVLKRPNALILRTNIFGWNRIEGKYSLAEWIIRELQSNMSIKGFKDVFFSSLYTFDLARILEKALASNLFGIYNCGSNSILSKYEFAMHIARRFGFNEKLIKPISIDDHTLKAKRGKNLSLNSNKLATLLNCELPTISETVKSFYLDFKDGIPEKIRAQRDKKNI